MLKLFIICWLLGAFAGTIAGLLGVGGGLIIVPVLAFVFLDNHFSPDVVMHLALGTSLATIVFTSISSVYAHQKRGAVLWSIAFRLAPGIIVGALMGAAIADQLPAHALRFIFGIFELLVAGQMAFGLKPNAGRHLAGSPGLFLAGSIIGCASAIVGIGGGSLTVPFLVWNNITMRNSVATSSACGLPIAVAGSIGFILMGWHDPALPAYSFGYIYWPAVLGIVFASVLFAPMGAWLAHRLPTNIVKQFFAVFLGILGVRMLIG